MAILDFSYYIVLFLIAIIGLYRFYSFDKAAKLIYAIIMIGATNEIIVSIFKYKKMHTMVLYHFYCVIDFFFIILFFLNAIKSRKKHLYILISSIILPLLAILNIIFLQPINKFNSNVFILESFSVIGMSLYSLYTILIDERLTMVYKYPNFWFWVFFLILNSGTFFFWACIFPISKDKNLRDIAQNIQVVINIFIYIGFGFILFFYPKMVRK